MPIETSYKQQKQNGDYLPEEVWLLMIILKNINCIQRQPI